MDGTLKATAIGAVSGALAATGIKLPGQIIGNVVLGAGDNISSQLEAMTNDEQDKFDGWSLASDIALSGLSATLCGPGAKPKLNSVLGEGKRTAKRLTSGFKGSKNLSITKKIVNGTKNLVSDFKPAMKYLKTQVKINLYHSTQRGKKVADYCLARTGLYMFATSSVINAAKGLKTHWEN